VADIRAVWADLGPPLFIGVTAIAQSLGMELKSKAAPTAPPQGIEPDPNYTDHEAVPADRPSIKELRAMFTQPGAGGDPTATARAMAKYMSKGTA
jgi:hypothetical protein